MITNISTKKMERLPAQDINFDKGLNIILGCNGSGKTTLLKAIKHSMTNRTQGDSKILISSGDKNIYLKYNSTHDEFENKMIDCDPIFDLTLKESSSLFVDNYQDGMIAVYNSNHMSRGEHKMNSLSVLSKKISSMGANRRKSTLYPVLVFDEPTLSQEPEGELAFFKYMKEWSSVMQIIIATNSAFCLGVEANFIEVNKGYKRRLTNFIKKYTDTLKDK